MKNNHSGYKKSYMQGVLVVLLSMVASLAIAGSAILTWNASPSDPAIVTGYKLYRGTASGTYQLSQTLGKVTTATESSLTAGTKYFWVVTAFNSAGESPFSNEASATIPFAIPGAATGLNAVGTP